MLAIICIAAAPFVSVNIKYLLDEILLPATCNFQKNKKRGRDVTLWWHFILFH